MDSHQPKSKILKSHQVDQSLSLEDRLQMPDAPRSSSETSGKVISSADSKIKKAAEDLLRKAVTEADQIKSRARDLYAQVEERIQQAEQNGYQAGRQKAETEFFEKMHDLEKQARARILQIEPQAVRLVYEMASKVIGEAFKASDESLLSMVRQTLSASLGKELVLLLHPEDYERLKEKQPSLLLALSGQQVLRLKASDLVKPHSCIVESEMGTIEANLDYQLAALRRALDLPDEVEIENTPTLEEVPGE